MQNQNRRYAFLIIGGAGIVLAFHFGYGAIRKWRFTKRFSAPVVAVEVDGIKKMVMPYRIEEKARFSNERSYLRGQGSLKFLLENGEAVECVYSRISNGEVLFVPPDLLTNEVLGTGQNLWPDGD